MEEARLDHEKPLGNPETPSDQGEGLTSAVATAEIPPDVSDTPQPEMHTEDAMEGHSAPSTSSSRRQSETERYLQDTVEEDSPAGTKSSSSRSSLSSIPDSVLVHPKEQSVYGRDSIGEMYEEQEEYRSYGSPVHQKIRDRNSPFRHPSSVKAILMQTEDEEDEDIMSRRKSMFRGSPTSVRSLGSPLLRRQGYHSAGGTPKRSPIKRENPLVLLHCTIIQPTVVLAPGMTLPDRQILEKVLPPLYWRRWKLLEEKIIASGLLRDRGLLIQHPQEDYGLLEERLLESLELQKPRLENGHFNNHETSESESEDISENPQDSREENKGACVDCGCHVNHRDNLRKWDVKFYAANGLMREGAWTAAWKEIERVDVQVSLWLPYEVKFEVEQRIKEENLLAVEKEQIQVTKPMVNQAEPNRQTRITQEEIDGLGGGVHDRTKSPPRHEPQKFERDIPAYDHDPDLHTLIIKSLRVLASDRRNIITAVSMLIAVLAVVFGGRPIRRTHGSDVVQFGDFPAVSTHVYLTSSTSVLTQISTEVPVSKSESCVERLGQVQRVVKGVEEVVPSVDAVVQPVEQPHDEITVVETHEQEAIPVPAVGTHIGIIEPLTETTTAEVPENTPSIDRNESVDKLPEATHVSAAAAENNDSAIGQGDDSCITQIENPAVIQDDDPVAAQEYEDDEPATITSAPQHNDSTGTQDDEFTITRIEGPAITEDDSRVPAHDDKADEPAIILNAPQHNDSAPGQDDNYSIKPEKVTITESNEPVVAYEDDHTKLQIDINETV
ncbi:conserved hypothetical protein [Talaromyces stipitatus ATCC 10500]|uniref:Flavoprotein oxygenase n=1 Tax=Talaromyces stipitatus (strain ATCC 10500 / CBS 375.48 / QM 6759 / NRRL 1006) TaxID=441959 RepID=B8M0E7_TALSN|nr:uncharacterized protein TSTA_084750 [Talaromyces stipitatus ATCC 10500]EED21244.1 conserved hypothetical protein [Talaromyces stipitatus ATCC 10500]